VLHVSHSPVHALLQHVPATQMPLVHSRVLPQEPPLAFFGKHAPPEQYEPTAHCASVVQVVRQAPAPLHLNAPLQVFGARGSLPLAIAEHVPLTMSQASHVPVHEVLQQYPSTQLPLRH
jgi:hypothetical protein